ncbi:MAG: sigma-70 family RNA polymerase sigma factor [Proteiniphilum sp.]|jgi:RNA polymerase sigma factor (sigma-70 family)|nr:sigma-70 family RNA polymerase sigma factor [Proteiniphilum sp.]
MNSDAWQQFLQGDENAFSELYCGYFDELLAYGLKIGFDEEVCKDAIQDVFCKIYTSRKQLPHVRNIEFYLLHCTKNRLFDIHNLESRVSGISYRDIMPEGEYDMVEKMIERETESLLGESIRQTLKVLPPKQRKIIYYHYQLNLTFDEIAAMLEIKPEAVRKSIYRALQKMRKSGRLKIESFQFL